MFRDALESTRIRHGAIALIAGAARRRTRQYISTRIETSRAGQ
jgi:hypothetical protein